MSEISFLKNENETKSLTEKIELNINNMLERSESYNPNFVKCLLEIALKHAKIFRIDIKTVSNASLNSLQQSLGIMLLEEYIILNENNRNSSSKNFEFSPPKSKKIKYSSESLQKPEV